VSAAKTRRTQRTTLPKPAAPWARPGGGKEEKALGQGEGKREKPWARGRERGKSPGPGGGKEGKALGQGEGKMEKPWARGRARGKSPGPGGGEGRKIPGPKGEKAGKLDKFIGIWRGVSKRVEDGHRPPAVRAGYP
jgi:hypothetical protein